MSDEKKPIPFAAPKVVNQTSPTGRTATPPPLQNIPMPADVAERLVARLEKAIIVAGALSGVLASGRVNPSRENRGYVQSAIREALEELKR